MTDREFALVVEKYDEKQEDLVKFFCSTVLLEFAGWDQKLSAYRVNGKHIGTVYLIITQMPFVITVLQNMPELNPERPPISIYVAGGWEFRRQIANINADLRAQNFRVVSGWIGRDACGKKTPQDLASDAQFDIDEVTEANVLLAIMDDSKYAYRGTFTEIGCALGQKKTVIIVCPGMSQITVENTSYPFYCMSNVFFWHPNIYRVNTVEEAISVIKTLYWTD